jgi:hypothetical protein
MPPLSLADDLACDCLCHISLASSRRFLLWLSHPAMAFQPLAGRACIASSNCTHVVHRLTLVPRQRQDRDPARTITSGYLACTHSYTLDAAETAADWPPYPRMAARNLHDTEQSETTDNNGKRGLNTLFNAMQEAVHLPQNLHKLARSRVPSVRQVPVLPVDCQPRLVDLPSSLLWSSGIFSIPRRRRRRGCPGAHRLALIAGHGGGPCSCVRLSVGCIAVCFLRCLPLFLRARPSFAARRGLPPSRALPSYSTAMELPPPSADGWMDRNCPCLRLAAGPLPPFGAPLGPWVWATRQTSGGESCPCQRGSRNSTPDRLCIGSCPLSCSWSPTSQVA